MNGAPATWTIDRLARLAAAALAAGAPTQPNGRIREVPDVRTIRWYTSIGLLDRPAAMRGRTALYGRPHLAQLVAIKRLQAAGLTVAAVQERLLGADAAVIEEIAELPADVEALVAQADGETATPADAAVADANAAAADQPAAGDAVAPSRARFWVAPPAPAPTPAPAPAPKAAIRAARRAAPTESATDITTGTPPAALISGVRLAPDVTLLLPPGRVPDAAARAAITEAAQPLLDLLTRLGLSES